MGRHSRKGPAPKGPDPDTRSGTASTGQWEALGPEAGGGRRGQPAVPGAEHTPFGHGAPQARGGHPEQHEPGGGWGAPQQYDTWHGGRGAQRTTSVAPPRPMPTGARVPGPRREFVEAFDRPVQGGPRGQDDPYASVTSWDDGPGRAFVPRESRPEDVGRAAPDDAYEASEEQPAKAGKGRTFTGIAAAAVTTVLAVVVAGQVVTDSSGSPSAQATGDDRGGAESPVSRSGGRKVPPKGGQVTPVAPASFARLMATQFPVDVKLKASGKFDVVPGFDKAPGKGRKIRYRVDIERGLRLDGALFAKAVQQTLNDDRSWAHGGEMTFERISSGEPEFIITLASPGTTDFWCAKSDLDTSEGNVSCDSAKTERVMINAYRWGQGSKTYGPKAMLTYRQMLINHEVGHRLGHDHVNCRTPGALAPVMQQQTKSLDINGIACRPNPWVYPSG